MTTVPGPVTSSGRVTRRGSRRTVPINPSPAQRDRLRALVEDPDTWVLRHDWDRYLYGGELHRATDPATLSADHRAAAIAWLRQQRHPLYRVLEGERRAPEGWLESLPLYRRLIELSS